MRSKRILPALFVTIALSSPVVAASFDPQANPGTAPSIHGTPLRSLLIEVAQNETRAIQHANPYLRYQIHTVDRKGDRVRDTIESKDGTVARLLLKDGRALTLDEDKAETDRLRELLASPADFAKHIHNDQTGKKLAIDLITLMPDAMTYTYVEGQPQIPSASTGRQIVIDYQPNPSWNPPTTTSQALTGLRGRMWIDAASHQLVRMEGTIFQGVNFGWGMLAHIYPGGTLSLDQTGVGGDRWIFTRFTEHIKVRAIMVKSFDENATIEASDFHILQHPPTYAEAIQQLLASPAPRL